MIRGQSGGLVAGESQEQMKLIVLIIPPRPTARQGREKTTGREEGEQEINSKSQHIQILYFLQTNTFVDVMIQVMQTESQEFRMQRDFLLGYVSCVNSVRNVITLVGKLPCVTCQSECYLTKRWGIFQASSLVLGFQFCDRFFREGEIPIACKIPLFFSERENRVLHVWMSMFCYMHICVA